MGSSWLLKRLRNATSDGDYESYQLGLLSFGSKGYNARLKGKEMDNGYARNVA
jgi:hypothetical protein